MVNIVLCLRLVLHKKKKEKADDVSIWNGKL